MNILKRIFGKGTPESDKQVNIEIENIKNGTINKLYPVLKRGDWVGIQAGAVKQTLVGTFEKPLLVLAFAYDAPTNLIFLTYKDIENKDGESFIKEAYENLENYETDFEVSHRLNNKVLFSSGKDFCSEKILCKSHMLKAQNLLGTNTLLVSIPRRRCMMVIAKNEDAEMYEIFKHLHNDAWKDDTFGNAPIVNGFFVVIDGQIDEVLWLD